MRRRTGATQSLGVIHEHTHTPFERLLRAGAGPGLQTISGSWRELEEGALSEVPGLTQQF